MTHLTDDDDDTELLENLVRFDPNITYSQAILPVLSFFWNRHIICSVIRPLVLVTISLILVGLLRVFPHNDIVRVSVLVGFALPLIGSALFLIKGIRMFVNNRQSAFKSAQNLLLERIQVGRANRKKDAYDLFLPPPPSITETKKTKFGIIFFPGALVNHTSYAPIASQLSDRGIVVVVLSLEPMRFITDTDATKKMALTAMHEILSMSNVATNIDEWVLAGHSAGAVTAINLAFEMKPDISKLVLCGIGGIGGNQLDKDKTLRDASVQALIINGSEDNLVNRLSEKVRESFRNLLPPTSQEGRSKGKTTHTTIEGGNHAGFGHYGPQNMDGIRTIALEEQQRIFIEKTVEFLSGNDETKKEK